MRWKFYNTKDFLWQKIIPQTLSKTFYSDVTKVINIGGKEVLKLPIIQNCDILKEYCEFIATVFREKASLKPDCTNEEARAALEQAMKECIKKEKHYNEIK